MKITQFFHQYIAPISMFKNDNYFTHFANGSEDILIASK